MSETFRKKHQARQSADWMLDDDGTPMGLIGPNGKLYKVVTVDNNEVTGVIEVSAGAVALSSSRAFSEALLLGDSFTARLHSIAFGGMPVVVDESTVSYTVGASSLVAAPGSLCRIKSADPGGLLDGWAEIVSHIGTTVVVRYPRTVTGITLSASNANIVEHALRNDTGWPVYAQAALKANGEDFDIVAAQGVAGDTFARILARYDTDVKPSTPCRVALLCGTNDASEVSASATPLATILENARTLVQRLMSDGCTVDLLAPTPYLIGYHADDTAAQECLAAIRNQHAGMARRYPAALRYIDTHTPLLAGGSAFADSAYISSNDKVHPTPAGAAKIGALYAEATAGTWTRGNVYYSYDNSDDASAGGRNKITNPTFQGAGGSRSGGLATTGSVSNTGSMPDSWVATIIGGSADISLAPRAFGGNDLRILWGTSGATGMQVTQDLTALGLQGSRRRVSVEIETAGDTSATHYINAALLVTTGGNTSHIALGRNQFSYAQGGRWLPAGQRYKLESEEMEIPADATAVVFRVFLQAGAAGTHECLIGDPQVF